MKLKEKVLSAALAASMVVPMAMPVVATEVNLAVQDTQSTTLKYEVGSHYTWQIHTAIDFGQNKGVGKKVAGTVTDSSEQKVKVTENVISEGQKLHITAAGSGVEKAFTFTNGGNELLSYAVKSGENAVDVNGDVLDVAAGTNTGETTMGFELTTTDKAAEVAGTYNGTITYTASIVAQ